MRSTTFLEGPTRDVEHPVQISVNGAIGPFNLRDHNQVENVFKEIPY